MIALISNESIIAIITLVATCPPSAVLIWHLLRRKHMDIQREVQGIVFIYTLVVGHY